LDSEKENRWGKIAPNVVIFLLLFGKNVHISEEEPEEV
jgi:hypothetical protein